MQSLAFRRPLIPLSCRSVSSSSTYHLFSWFSDVPTATTIESGLLQLHDVCGNWSLEIFACTVAARILVSIPSMTYTRKLFTTYSLTTHPIREKEVMFRKEMERRMTSGSMPPQMVRDMRLQGLRLLRASMKETIEHQNVHPGKGLVVIGLESIFWISYAVALRNIVAGYPPSPVVAAAQMDMSSQGLLWFQNLTLPDPYCILPVTASLILLSSVQIMSVWRQQNGIPEMRLQKIIRWASFPAAFWLTYVLSNWPATIAFYMCTSMAIGAFQAFAFTHPSVQRLLRIPQIHGHDPAPLSFKRWLRDEGFIRPSRL